MRRPEVSTSACASADECEQLFYEAMQLGDVELMMRLWSDEDEIACIHPGGQRLIGPEAIRASFAAMFRGGGTNVRADRVRRLDLLETSVHHVVERVQAETSEGRHFALIVVTNVYVRSALGWRMVLHHASPNGAQGVVVEGSPSGRITHDPDDSGRGPNTLH